MLQALQEPCCHNGLHAPFASTYVYYRDVKQCTMMRSDAEHHMARHCNCHECNPWLPDGLRVLMPHILSYCPIATSAGLPAFSRTHSWFTAMAHASSVRDIRSQSVHSASRHTYQHCSSSCEALPEKLYIGWKSTSYTSSACCLGAVLAFHCNFCASSWLSLEKAIDCSQPHAISVAYMVQVQPVLAQDSGWAGTLLC